MLEVRSMRRSWLPGVLLLAACSGSEPAPFRVEVATGGASAGWLQDPTLARRTLAAARTAATQWGGADLDGWTVRYVGDIAACGAEPPDAATMGCAHQDERIIELKVSATSPCVEGTALLHEIGHVALPGDPDDADPRWSSGEFWYALLGAMQDGIGANDPSCAKAIAAWRLWWRGKPD